MTAALTDAQRRMLRAMDDAHRACRWYLPPTLDAAFRLEDAGLCATYVGGATAPRPGLRYATITDAGRAALAEARS